MADSLRRPSRKQAELAMAAVSFAVSVLQDDRVRDRLRSAPRAAKDWAERHRPLREPGDESVLRRVDPTSRFGRRGIERRLGAIRRNVDLVFGDRRDADAGAVFEAVDALERALVLTATMPVTARTRARHRIAGELAALELALVDAVLERRSP